MKTLCSPLSGGAPEKTLNTRSAKCYEVSVAVSGFPQKSLPKQEEIYLSLKQRIEDGTYPVGDYLPSTRVLAKSFRTSGTPVNVALGQLQRAGYAEAIHGSGVRVSARSSGEAAIRRKPVVELITALSSTQLGVPPSDQHRHSLSAVQEWLLWHLNQRDDLRVRLANVWRDLPNAQFTTILDDLTVYRPNVVAFSFPEDISDENLVALERAHSLGTHVVYRASRRDFPQFDRVYSDFRTGQAELTRHLLERGHREIVRLAANLDLLYEQQKQEGYRDALVSAGYPPETADAWTVQVRLAEIEPQARVERTIGLLHKQFVQRKVDAVMAHNDLHVGTVRAALRWMNREDVTVVGFDDDWDEQVDHITEAFGPEAARDGAPVTVDTCLPEVGTAMAELVLGRALGEFPKKPQSRLVRQTVVSPPNAASTSSKSRASR